MAENAVGTSGEFPVWRTPEGEPVSCVEKIKVLNENLAELRGLAQDALEDAQTSLRYPLDMNWLKPVQ